jgi:hypothetical protein
MDVMPDKVAAFILFIFWIFKESFKSFNSIEESDDFISFGKTRLVAF